MNANPENVISVHCKGGKGKHLRSYILDKSVFLMNHFFAIQGRTGTCICIWLLESRECASAKEALDKFGDRRTNWDKGNVFQGVETPSQSRFVGYYDIITNKLGGLLPPIRVLKLAKVIIHSIKGIGNGDGSDLSMIAYNVDKTVAVSCNFSNDFNCKVCPFYFVLFLFDFNDTKIDLKSANSRARTAK
jgi:PTEN phosphatase family protein